MDAGWWAAIIAGLGLLYSVWQDARKRFRRHRSHAQLTFNLWSSTVGAMMKGTYDRCTVTNVSESNARLDGRGYLIRNREESTGDRAWIKGKMILRAGEQDEIANKAFVPNWNYLVFSIVDRTDKRVFGTTIYWDPLKENTELGLALSAQKVIEKNLPPNWLTGFNGPKAVGPHGVSKSYIPNRWSESRKQQWKQVALGDIAPAQMNRPNRVRRLLLWLWNLGARATRKPHRHFPLEKQEFRYPLV